MELSRVLRAAVVPLLLLGVTVTTTPASSVGAVGARADELSRRPSTAATVLVPARVTEGQRYTVRVRVKQPRQLKRVLLQQQRVNVFGDREWSTKRSFVPRRRLSAGAVAGATDRDRYRLVLVSRQGRKSVTRSAATTIWHWYALSGFDTYYETYGADHHSFQFTINGRAYRGWYTYSDYDSWESRFTPGRNCSTFRGDFGVNDRSADGSSAEITITTDNGRVAYSSPTLTPGMVARRTIDLRRTYRFSILGTNTSPDGVRAWPGIGDPQLLCTGYED